MRPASPVLFEQQLPIMPRSCAQHQHQALHGAGGSSSQVAASTAGVPGVTGGSLRALNRTCVSRGLPPHTQPRAAVCLGVRAEFGTVLRACHAVRGCVCGGKHAMCRSRALHPASHAAVSLLRAWLHTAD
jgi:hypothetical protein